MRRRPRRRVRDHRLRRPAPTNRPAEDKPDLFVPTSRGRRIPSAALRASRRAAHRPARAVRIRRGRSSAGESFEAEVSWLEVSVWVFVLGWVGASYIFPLALDSWQGWLGFVAWVVGAVCTAVVVVGKVAQDDEDSAG